MTFSKRQLLSIAESLTQDFVDVDGDTLFEVDGTNLHANTTIVFQEQNDRKQMILVTRKGQRSDWYALPGHVRP